MTSGPPPIVLRDVGLVMGETRVLDRVSLALAPGEHVAIVGEAGVGKSLIARLALGLIQPTDGSVSLFGEEPATLDHGARRRLRARCGVALQGGSLFGELSVEDNLRLGFAPARGDPPRHRRRIDRLLIDFGLEHRVGTSAGLLSAGAQRRLELARAFLRDPALLVLDEPFEGALGRASQLETQLRTQLIGRPRALLLLTQDVGMAERLATRVVTLRRGRLWETNAG